jgi:hypothetical protein
MAIDDSLQLRIGHRAIRAHDGLSHSLDNFPQYKPFNVERGGRWIGDKRELTVGKPTPQPGEQMRLARSCGSYEKSGTSVIVILDRLDVCE